ncbi:MAG TPA: exonuclease, partial [Propionibacteriaceae bacterium]|nr:exonuclease [Propionibacteriaceae bacterium]
QLRSGLNSVLDDRDVPGLEAVVEEIKVQVRRWKDFSSMLLAMVNEPRNDLIYWLETPPGGGAVSMHAAPLHVGELVQQHLLGTKDCVIMTSATLTADNQFDYMQERLGAWDMETVAVGSPFDYQSSTLVWIPTDIPEPRQPYHQKAVEDVLRAVSLALEGRTLALFTAYTQLRATARAIAPELEAHEIIVYEQGDGTSRNQLLESFKKSSRAVLLGTRSFWEGIDVTGDALSCVFIMRLPFAVPSDPVVAARSETFEDPFQEYSLPDAILRFRQGFGRLIRNKTDRGVVVILDNRVLNKPYGQAFLDSLPACTVRRGSSANLPEVARRWVNGNS